jgi:hypothetical protein
MKVYSAKVNSELQILLNFVSAKAIKKLCYISSTAALENLAENDSIITEESEWTEKKLIVIMPFQNMVLDGSLAKANKRARCYNS